MKRKLSVLIVEDNATKRQQIESALPKAYLFDIQSTASIAQAYLVLDKKEYDLIILDMTFQVSQNGGQEVSKEAMAGVELLQYVTRRQKSSPVIVATQHTSFFTPNLPPITSIEGLHSLLARLFPTNYRSTVLVDLSEESWKAQLQDAIVKVVEAG